MGGGFSPVFPFHPTNPSTSSQRKKFSLPSLLSFPVPLRPIPGSHRDPPFPHIRDAGNAHFWVSIANTPLPKHPSAWC